LENKRGKRNNSNLPLTVKEMTPLKSLFQKKDREKKKKPKGGGGKDRYFEGGEEESGLGGKGRKKGACRVHILRSGKGEGKEGKEKTYRTGPKIKKKSELRGRRSGREKKEKKKSE